jgi:hypothetical protein
MKATLLASSLILAFPLLAAADSISWSWANGWDKGFVLEANPEESTVTLRNRTSGEVQTKVLHNPKEVMKYFDALLKKIPNESVGQDSDDGPRNLVKYVSGGRTVKLTIYDVSPPYILFHSEIPYPAEAELGEANRFLQHAEVFLLLNQLQEFKTAYFPRKDIVSHSENQAEDGADQPATAPESESKGKDKPQPESEAAPR